MIEAFYCGAKDVELRLAVTFEDGSESFVAAHMTIQEAA